jgi:hypothetical protein
MQRQSRTGRVTLTGAPLPLPRERGPACFPASTVVAGNTDDGLGRRDRSPPVARETCCYAGLYSVLSDGATACMAFTIVSPARLNPSFLHLGVAPSATEGFGPGAFRR